MPKRLQHEDATIDAFGDEFLVLCPRCSQRAVVRDRGQSLQPRIVLSCLQCGYNQFWETRAPGIVTARNQNYYKPGQIGIGDAVDWYFHLPLWLQMPCCGNTLWAYNLAHLAFIEDYVQATLRERQKDHHGWSNRSLRSRLPKWIQPAKNRSAVLECIEKLKQKA
jgi:hypothetical protein